MHNNLYLAKLYFLFEVIMTEIVKVSAGGEKFEFSKTTLQRPQNKNSVLERRVSGAWDSANEIFLDVDSAIFRKVCAPYIRFSVLPTKKDFTSLTEANHTIATCNEIGLHILADYIRGAFKTHMDVRVHLKCTNSEMENVRVSVYTTDTFAQLREECRNRIPQLHEENSASIKRQLEYIQEKYPWRHGVVSREREEEVLKAKSKKIEFKPLPDEPHFVCNGLIVGDDESLSQYGIEENKFTIELEDY